MLNKVNSPNNCTATAITYINCCSAFLAMDLKELKETLTEFKQRAIKLACALKDNKETDVDYVSFDEEEVEVVFTWPSGCNCCSDVSETVYIPYEDLFKDIDAIVAEKEQQLAKAKRKKEEAEKLQKQKEAEAKEKRERRNYERLKQKYEGGA